MLRCLLLPAWVSLLSFTSLDLQSSEIAQCFSTDDDLSIEISDVFKRQVAAWNEGDLEKFMATYWKSDKLTFSSGGKTTRGWDATLSNYKKGYPNKATMGHLTFSGLEIQPIGNEGALALGRWHLKRTKQGKDDSIEGNFSVVFRKIKGEWKIIHDHSSSLDKNDEEEIENENADQKKTAEKKTTEKNKD